jgi:glutamate synthase (NADPH/NADH) small chain
MTNTLHFVDTAQAYPEKREAAARARDFGEIYARFQPKQAETQASRCSQCGIPYCQVHCPLQNNIPDWLMLTAEGRLEEAYALSSATNTFPEICGRICPQDRLCEGNCVIEKDFGAVTIGSVEKYITETAWDNGWIRPIKPRLEHKQSVGIIGAGPAGLAAADVLRRKGVQVHIYDRYTQMGGLLMYGIPNFKLDKSVVSRRNTWLLESGVQFYPDMNVDASLFATLQKKHDALLIATGVYKARALQTVGSGLQGIIPALDYLVHKEQHVLQGKNVVVVGGGDTAMDCVRTAIRQGAASVTCLYRRDKANMPGSSREVHHAEEEGVVFKWLSSPLAFLGNTAVEGVKVQQMQLGQPDSFGRQQPEAVKDATYTLQADAVILALGFEPEDMPQLFGVSGLDVTESGTLAVDEVYQTSLANVYAAGDIVRGASLVVWAIKEGREAAAAMIKQMGL